MIINWARYPENADMVRPLPFLKCYIPKGCFERLFYTMARKRHYGVHTQMIMFKLVCNHQSNSIAFTKACGEYGEDKAVAYISGNISQARSLHVVVNVIRMTTYQSASSFEIED